MVATREKSDTRWPYREVLNNVRAWGWQFVAEGVKEASFKRGKDRQTIKRTEEIDAYNGALVRLAQFEGLTVEKWMQGPPQLRTKIYTRLSEDDIEFFLSTVTPKPSEEPRYKIIRDTLEREGTLQRYMKVRAKRLEEKQNAALAQPALISTPIFEHKHDEEGYITLDQALEKVGRKQNVLNATTCKIISVLAEGNAEDSSGRATRILMEKMQDPPSSTGAISSLVSEFEKAGLVWRDCNGKRTFKIGLCYPVRLFEELVETNLVPQANEDTSDSVAPVSSESIVYERDESWQDQIPEPDLTKPSERDSMVNPAIEVLKQELTRLIDEVQERTTKISALTYSINILEQGDLGL